MKLVCGKCNALQNCVLPKIDYKRLHKVTVIQLLNTISTKVEKKPKMDNTWRARTGIIFMHSQLNIETNLQILVYSESLAAELFFLSSWFSCLNLLSSNAVCFLAPVRASAFLINFC